MKINDMRVRAVLAAAAIGLLAGCSSGAGTPTPTAPGPAATTASAPSPTAQASTAAPPLVLTTPQAAAEHLYNAWKAGDTASAGLAASSSAVATLFATAWKADTYFFGGCTQPTAPSECDYNWTGGVVAMTIAGDSTAGFRVTAVSRGSAG